MKKFQRIKQPVSSELSAALLDFVRRKFYLNDDAAFYQDRRHLMGWVVLWPASWFISKDVSIHGDQYREIFFKVLLQADAHRSDKIKYRPAWLKSVLQKHFAMHGDEYLDEAKSVRNLAEQVLLMVGHNRAPAPDPVRELATARAILATQLFKKKAVKASANPQLSFL